MAAIDLYRTALGSGPVCLVPSPGWGMSCEHYRAALSPLADTFSLVFLDSRGCGRSPAPATTCEYRYADFAADLEGARRALGQDRVWVLGHSHAGVQAMRFASDHPAAAAGLLLVGTYAETDAAYSEDVKRREAKRAGEPWYKELDWDSPSTDEGLTRLFADALPLYFRDLEKMRAGLARAPIGACRVHAFKGWKDSENGAVHILDRLGAIRCPTLLVVGEDDFVCSPMNSERIRGRISGARMTVLPDCGHFPWVERPDEFFAAVRGFASR